MAAANAVAACKAARRLECGVVDKVSFWKLVRHGVLYDSMGAARLGVSSMSPKVVKMYKTTNFVQNENWL
jgi:hypothetical protein